MIFIIGTYKYIYNTLSNCKVLIKLKAWVAIKKKKKRNKKKRGSLSRHPGTARHKTWVRKKKCRRYSYPGEPRYCMRRSVILNSKKPFAEYFHIYTYVSIFSKDLDVEYNLICYVVN